MSEEIQRKTLAEMRMEVEQGLTVYAHPSLAMVYLDTDTDGHRWYVFFNHMEERERPWTHITPDRSLLCHVFHPERDSWGIGALIPVDDCYDSFDALLADWPAIAAQPIWSTTPTNIWSCEGEPFEMGAEDQSLF